MECMDMFGFYFLQYSIRRTTTLLFDTLHALPKFHCAFFHKKKSKVHAMKIH